MTQWPELYDRLLRLNNSARMQDVDAVRAHALWIYNTATRMKDAGLIDEFISVYREMVDDVRNALKN